MASVRRSRTVGHGDLGDHLAEEAAHHQPAGLVFGDAAGLQVEQLLVVETAGGAGVSGADDLAGLDLQVRHRVGAGAVGEHQVAVHLEGVGASAAARISTSPIQTVCASGFDESGSPCSAPLYVHVRLAVRLGVVDEQPLFEVLAGVGEVQAEQLGVAAGRVEPRPRRQPHQVAAERDRDVAQHRVPAERRVVGADVHGVVGPVGDRDDGQPGAVADDELDVVGEGSAALLVDDDHGLGELADPHLQVPVGRRALAGPGDGDHDRLADLGVLPTVTIVALLNDDHAWAATRSAGTPPWPSRSSPRRTVSTVTPGRSRHVDVGGAGRRGGRRRAGRAAAAAG